MFGFVLLKEDENLAAFINFTKDSDTEDQLRLGLYRDFYAEKFFPLISTVMTRASYFFHVPMACFELEKKFNRGTVKTYFQLKDELQKIQKIQAEHMIDSLAKGTKLDNTGIFGWDTLDRYNRKKFVKRTPFEVYWRSIRKLGIANIDHGSTGYLSLLASGAFSQIDVSKKEKVNRSIWREEFLHHDLKIDLVTPNQSKLLFDLFTQHEETRHTLLAYILLNAQSNRIKEISDDSFINYLDIIPDKQLITYIKNSPKLGALTVLANTYYDVLAYIKWQSIENTEHRNWKKFEDLHEEGLKRLKNDELIKLALDCKFYETDSDGLKDVKEFLQSFQRLLENGPLKQSAYRKEFDEKLKKRELNIKGGGARLSYDSALKKWSPGKGTSLPNYRWHNARRILNDIIGNLP